MSDQLNLTKEDLNAIISSAVSAAVSESKKPKPLTEQELADKEMEQQHRADSAQSVIAALKNQKDMQLICSHEHTKREGGGTHCLWIREENPNSPGYILCQKCQGRIRPNVPAGTKILDARAIYNTALFNKLFQDCNEGELLG
jgi:hypothetical protein